VTTRKLTVVLLTATLMFLLAGCDYDFLQTGFDAAQTKFSPEVGVTASNVGTLHRLWVANVQGGASSHSTPAVATIDKVKYAFVATSNGYLEKRRADTGAAVWAVDNHSAGAGAEGTTTSSPAIVTPSGGTTQVVIGSLDGHVYSYDARTGALLWQFPAAGTYTLVPVTTSPTVTPGGYVFVTVGQQFSTALTCIPFGNCGVAVTWTIERIDPHDGSVHGAWGLGGGAGFAAADSGGHIVPGSGVGGPSSAAYDPATGLVFAGEPDVLPDLADNILDPSSGVLALNAPDSGGGVSFAWEQRWSNNFAGVAAAPAVSGGRVFVESNTGLRSFNETSGAPIATNTSAHSYFSSPAVAAGTVFATTDNGYTRALHAASLAQVWTSGQALDSGNNPVDTATPVVVGENDSKGVVPYVVFDTNGNGDLKTFNAAGSGTNTAIVTINDHGTGKGGVAVSGGVVFVQGTDGQLRAFGR